MKFLGIYLACSLILTNVIMAEDEDGPQMTGASRVANLVKKKTNDFEPDDAGLVVVTLPNNKKLNINTRLVMIRMFMKAK